MLGVRLVFVDSGYPVGETQVESDPSRKIIERKRKRRLLVEKKTTAGATMRKSTTIRRFFPLFFKGWSIHFKTSLRGVKPAVGVVKLLSTVSIYSFLSSGVLYLSFLILAIISINSLGSINFFFTRSVTS